MNNTFKEGDLVWGWSGDIPTLPQLYRYVLRPVSSTDHLLIDNDGIHCYAEHASPFHHPPHYEVNEYELYLKLREKYEPSPQKID